MTYKDIKSICDLGQLEKDDFYKTVNKLATLPGIRSKATRLASYMQDWFTEYTNFDLETKEVIANNIVEFAKCPRKPWFTDMGGKDRIYRGISRPIMDLRKVKFMRFAYPFAIGTTTYDPKMPVQSWTTDPKIADRFHTSNPDTWMNNIPWLMSLKPRKQDIVFGTTYTRLMSHFPNEKEVVVHLPNPTTLTLMVGFEGMMRKLRDAYRIKPAEEWEQFFDFMIGKQNADLLRGTDDYKSWKRRMIK